MLQKPFIKLRNLKELQSSQKLKAENDEFATPLKVKKTRKPRSNKKNATNEAPADNPGDDVATTPASVSTSKRIPKSSRKEPPPNQLRINAFFKTCQKTYKIEPAKEEPTPRKAATEKKVSKRTATTTKKSPRRPKTKTNAGRKRLFVDETSNESSENSMFSLWNEKKTNVNTVDECISVIDSEDEGREKTKIVKTENVLKSTTECKTDLSSQKSDACEQRKQTTPTSKNAHVSSDTSEKENRTTPTLSKHSSNSPAMAFDSGTSKPVSCLSSPQTTTSLKTRSTRKQRKPKPCPPYKIIENTTFAVDAFQYGCIEGVTHYFLSHFHADHYIGLTKKFAMPLYMSTITARLVRSFIHVDEQYIQELDLNAPIVLNNIEITALDANHCPGAVMFLFKFLDTGKCILHTGDFRAWYGMESEPTFWNNDIATIYLDTTYISHKYAFCTQGESIDKAKDLVHQFRVKHADKRILYICGSYVIGKEKFWSSLADEFELKVWTEDNRYKALQAMDDKELNKILIESPLKADMHVIAMGKLTYLNLVDYFSMYEHRYDIMLAIRPSGWEKDSRPQYRGKINIIGVEYSEHSSFEEMQRFVKFLKPENVISTVPVGRDLMQTAKVPDKWYKYEKLQSSSNYQPRIEQFLGKIPNKRSIIRMPNAKRGGLEMFVSPLTKKHTKVGQETSINDGDYEDDLTIASAHNLDQPLAIHQRQIDEKENDTRNKSEKVKESPVSVSQTKIKQEKLLASPVLKQSTNIKQNRQKRGVKLSQKLLNEPADNTADLILSQALKDGESCSIFIPNDKETQPTSAAKSSDGDYFEMPLLQKRNRRVGKRKINKSFLPSDTVTENEDELETEVPKLSEKGDNNNARLTDTPTTSKMAAILNPARTTSCASSAASETCKDNDFENTPRLTKNRPDSLNPSTAQNDIISASQTTLDLENTTRPLRNKTKYLSAQNDIIPASQTFTEWENSPRPLRNKFKGRSHVQAPSSQNDIIPASQTTMDLENTPRPIRNKRCTTTPVRPSDASPTKKTKEDSPTFIDQRSTCLPQNALLTQIYKSNQSVDIDIYNTSQLVDIVTETLADKQPDTSVEHIPRELLSSDDAEDDWLY